MNLHQARINPPIGLVHGSLRPHQNPINRVLLLCLLWFLACLEVTNSVKLVEVPERRALVVRLLPVSCDDVILYISGQTALSRCNVEVFGI